jgi:two-component system, NarL family, nitrate/nitrite response regulator NarL
MSCVSLVIADGCPVFLCGLISILGSEHDFDVVACCCSGIESLQAIRDLSPDIALLDCSMPLVSGVNALATAISEGSHTRIVLLAAPAELRSIFAVAVGAYGIIPRNAQPEVLVHGLRQVADGRRLSLHGFCAREACSGERDAAENALATLTGRERQIVNLVSEGLSNNEVGQRLKLTPGTIKVHLHNIFSKLAINSRTALTSLVVHDRYKSPIAAASKRHLRAATSHA